MTAVAPSTQQLDKQFKAVFCRWNLTFALPDTSALRAELATLCSAIIGNEDIDVVVRAVNACGWQQVPRSMWLMVQYKAYNQAIAAVIARSSGLHQLERTISSSDRFTELDTCTTSPLAPKISGDFVQVSAEFQAPRCLTWSGSLRRQAKVQAARAARAAKAT